MARFHSPDSHEDHAELQHPESRNLGSPVSRSEDRLHRLSSQMMADAEEQPLPRALRDLALELAAALATRDGGDDDRS